MALLVMITTHQFRRAAVERVEYMTEPGYENDCARSAR
jgi:hypothetical protein